MIQLPTLQEIRNKLGSEISAHPSYSKKEKDAAINALLDYYNFLKEEV